MILHAGLIAVCQAGRWRGALISGPSGAGKSDLALRALDQGWRLVADDYTLIWSCGGRLYGRAPDALFGLIEVRGQGVLRLDALRFAAIDLVARCPRAGEPVERLPEPSQETLLGIELPALDLKALEDSAPAKLRRAIEHLGVRA